MLRINRVRAEIKTKQGLYGIDEQFYDGLNFISSSHNTCGKSSILTAIYYCLGFEQIVGGGLGTGNKVLTSVYKTKIDIGDNEQSLDVLESSAYLEISNGNSTITILRSIKSEYRDDKLVTVYYSTFDDRKKSTTQVIDYYVHLSNSANNEKGFHKFLEDFLYLELPKVLSSENVPRKLYLQIIFSAMFIEQKHGWSGILAGIPTLGIRDAKKRTVEYILAFETFKNEIERNRINELKAKTLSSWVENVKSFTQVAKLNECILKNISYEPCILSSADISEIILTTANNVNIKYEIEKLNKEYEKTKKVTPLVVDNFEILNIELEEVLKEIKALEDASEQISRNISFESNSINKLESNITTLKSDITNNKDAARLQKLGSDLFDESIVQTCPVCRQSINDNLLADISTGLFMDIEQNIKHLEEQLKMFSFSLDSHKECKQKLGITKSDIESKLLKLRRLAQAIRSDITESVESSASEALLLKRIEISLQIANYSKLLVELDKFRTIIKRLSDDWTVYLSEKSKLPKAVVSDRDKSKIQLLEKIFIGKLKSYNYKSLTSFQDIQISNEQLMPTVAGFDLKFDSSASDGIRVIWAFTMALLEVSLTKSGNHPGVLIFDEPAQQSIVSEDMKSFIESILSIKDKCQVILGVTLISSELLGIVNSLPADSYNQIHLDDKAFKKII